MKWQRLWLAGVALLSFALTGCVSDMLARKIVTAPNRQDKPWPPKGSEIAKRFEKTYAQQFTVNVGPPAAELAVAVLEPGDYALRYGSMNEAKDDGRRVPKFSADWKPRLEGSTISSRGTVVILHGFLVSKESMMHWGLFLAQQGFRTVLVDLRGHGQSTGEWITFGATEAPDLVKVMDEIEHRGLAPNGAAVLGLSYGAVMGMHWAARDPRVKAIIALEPFSDPRRAVTEFVHGFPPFKKQLAKIGEGTLNSAVTHAPELAHFSWAETSVFDSLKQLRHPVLFFHGTDDTWIFPAHSQRLVELAPAGSRLILVPRDNHETLSARLDPIAFDVLEWLEQHGVGGAASSP